MTRRSGVRLAGSTGNCVADKQKEQRTRSKQKKQRTRSKGPTEAKDSHLSPATQKQRTVRSQGSQKPRRVRSQGESEAKDQKPRTRSQGQSSFTRDSQSEAKDSHLSLAAAYVGTSGWPNALLRGAKGSEANAPRRHRRQILWCTRSKGQSEAKEVEAKDRSQGQSSFTRDSQKPRTVIFHSPRHASGRLDGQMRC